MRRPAPDLLPGALLVTSLLGAGCPAALSPFEGVWTVTDGGTTVVCDGGTFATTATQPIVIIDNGHLSLTVSIEGQSESFETSGDSAAAAQATLYLTDDAGFQDRGTLLLEMDGLTLSGHVLSENATGSETRADGSICSFSRGLTATRDLP